MIRLFMKETLLETKKEVEILLREIKIKIKK